LLQSLAHLTDACVMVIVDGEAFCKAFAEITDPDLRKAVVQLLDPEQVQNALRALNDVFHAVA
jgi:hypothetical protein